MRFRVGARQAVPPRVKDRRPDGQRPRTACARNEVEGIWRPVGTKLFHVGTDPRVCPELRQPIG